MVDKLGLYEWCGDENVKGRTNRDKKKNTDSRKSWTAVKC